MNLNKNEIKIIKLLISSSTYLSSYEISSLTQINRRSIRNIMSNIKTTLHSLGYELEAKSANGYMIKNLSPQSINHLSQVIEKAEIQRESLFPIMSDEKEIFIIRHLIETNDYLKIDELAEKLLTSRPVVSSALKTANVTLLKHDLSIKQKPNYGIRIEGNEINKRKVLCDYIFYNLNTSKMLYDFINCFISDKNSLEYGIIEILEKHDIELPDITLLDIFLCITVAINRISNNMIINSSLDLSPIKDREEFEVAKEIAVYLKKNGNYDMNKYEIEQLAIQLICKRPIKESLNKNNQYLKHIIDELIFEIKEKTLLQFNYPNFYKDLLLNVEIALLRDFYNEKKRTTLFYKAKPFFPLAYELAEITASILNKYTKKPLSVSELVSFTIFYNSVIRIKKEKKIKVLLLCALGYSSEIMYKNIIDEKFGNFLKIYSTSFYYKLSNEDIKQYDLVITTIPIHRNFPIPHVSISQNISDEDLDEIEHFVYYTFNKDKPEYLFNPKLYIDHVKANDKKEVANEFYKLIKNLYSNIKVSFKNSLISSNKSELITYNNGLAIIKLNTPINNNNTLAVLLLEKAIIWDKQKVQLIILFSSPDPKNYIYNTISNNMMSFSYKKQAIDTLFKNPSYTLFLQTFGNR